MKTHKKIKTLWQRVPGVDQFEIEGKKITWKEFEKLQGLMPEINWIVVRWSELPNKAQ